MPPQPTSGEDNSYLIFRDRVQALYRLRLESVASGLVVGAVLAVALLRTHRWQTVLLWYLGVIVVQSGRGALMKLSRFKPEQVADPARWGRRYIADVVVGGMDIRREPVEVRQLMDRALLLFGGEAFDKGLSIRCTRSSAWVSGDSLALQRIVSNLVANAVRQTQSGRVLVGARRQGAKVRLLVLDTGPGIEVAVRDRIFLRSSTACRPQQGVASGWGWRPSGACAMQLATPWDSIRSPAAAVLSGLNCQRASRRPPACHTQRCQAVHRS